MVRLRNSSTTGPPSGFASSSNNRGTTSGGAPHTTPLPLTFQSVGTTAQQQQTNSMQTLLPVVPPPPIITSAIVSSSGPSGNSSSNIIAPSPTSGSLIQRRRRTSSTSTSPHGSLLLSSGGVGGTRGVGRTLSNASSSWEIETTPSTEQQQQQHPDEFYDYELYQQQSQSQSQYMYGGYSYQDPQQQQSQTQQSSYQHQSRQRTATYPARQLTPSTTKNTATATNKVIDLNQPHNSYYYSHYQGATTNTNATTSSSTSQQQYPSIIGYGDTQSRSSQHSYKFDSDYYNDTSEHTTDTGFYDDLNILEAGGGSLSSPRLRKGSPRQVVAGSSTTGRWGIFSDETKKAEKLLEALQAPKLEDYHTTFRTPLHVPDRDYKKFLESTGTDDDDDRRERLLLQLRPGKKINYNRKGGGGSSSKGGGTCTKQCCAGTCAGFSLIGFLFLLMIGILLDTQPLYIRGSLPEQIAESSTRTAKKNVVQRVVPKRSNNWLSKTNNNNNNNNTTIQRLPTASNAYKAAMLYLVSFLFSLYCIYPDSINQKFIVLWQRIQRLLEMSGIIHKVRVSAVCYYTKRRIRRFLRHYCRWCYKSRDWYYYYDDIPDNHNSDSAVLPTTYRSNDHPYHYSSNSNNNNNAMMDGVGTGNSSTTTRNPTNYLGDSMAVMSSYIQSFWRPSYQDSHRTRRRRRRRRNSDRGGGDQGGGIDVVMTGGSSSLGITIGSGMEDDDDDDADFNINDNRRTKNDTLLPLRHNTSNKHYPLSSSLSAAPGSSHSASSIGTSSYHAYSSNYNDTGIWNRTKGRIQQYLTVRGFYLKPARRSRNYAQKKREV